MLLGSPVILSATKLSLFILSFIMLSVNMLSVIVLAITKLSDYAVCHLTESLYYELHHAECH